MEGTLQLHALAAFHRGNNSHYALNRRFGGPQIQCRRFGEKNCLLLLLNPPRQAHGLVTVLSVLSELPSPSLFVRPSQQINIFIITIGLQFVLK